MPVNRSDVNVTPAKTSVTGDAAGYVKVSQTSTTQFEIEQSIKTDDVGDNQVTAGKLAANAITPSHTATTGDSTGYLVIPEDRSLDSTPFTVSNTLDGGKLTDGSVSTDKLADAAVTGGKIAGSTITATNILNETITANELHDGTVTAAKCNFNRTKMASYDPDGFSNAGIVVVNRNDSAFSKAWTLSANAIADGAITSAKLESSLANVISSMPSIEFGQSSSLDIPAASHITVDVTFSATKTEAPLAFATLQTSSADATVSVTVQSVTNSQVSFTVANTGSTDISGATLDWLTVSGR